MFKKATTCAILYVCGTFTLAFKFFHQISQIDDFCRSQNTLKGQLLSNIFQARKGYGNGFTYHAQILLLVWISILFLSLHYIYIVLSGFLSSRPVSIRFESIVQQRLHHMLWPLTSAFLERGYIQFIIKCIKKLTLK